MKDTVPCAVTVRRMRRDVAIWSSRYSFILGPRIGAGSFHPAPRVDAALLAVRLRG